MSNKQAVKSSGGIAKDQKSNFGAKGWLLVLFCAALFFIGGGSVNDGMNAVVPAFSGAFGWSTGLLYSLNTIGGWVGIIGAVVFGALAQRKGVKATVIVSLLLGVAAMFLWGRANSVALFAVALFAMNIAQNGFMQVGPSTLAANWFPTKKGLVMGWMTMGCNVATAIYVRIFSGVMGKSGLTRAFDVFAIFMVVLLIVAVVFLKSNPEEAGCYPDNDKSMTPEDRDRLFELGKTYERTSPWTVKKLLSTKVVWLIGIAYGIIIMITLGTISQLVPTIMSLGFSENFALNMMTICAIIGLVFSYLFGLLDAKIGTRKASLVFYIWTMLAILFMALPGKWTVYPAVFFMGGFVGAGNNLTASITSTVFGRYDFSKAWSVIFPITVAVRSLGYGIVGVLADLTGGYTVPYVVLLGCALVAFILIFVMKDTCIGRNYISSEEENAAR